MNTSAARQHYTHKQCTPHQYTGVAINGRAILVGGPPGIGKSALALALIDRGAQLIGDDMVALSIHAGALVAKPAQNISGLIELRNVGIIKLPTSSAPVSLILQLTGDAPRFVTHAEETTILGQAIPTLLFTLNGLSDAIRAEYALKIYGLHL